MTGLRVVGREAVKTVLFQLQNTQAEIQTHISDSPLNTEQRTDPQPTEVSQALMALNLHLAADNNNLHGFGRKNASFRKEELK